MVHTPQVDDLRDARLLQSISAEIVHEKNIDSLYEKIVDAAVQIMRADFASMQMLHPARGPAGGSGKLQLIAYRGFTPEAAKFWEWVRADSKCTCGIALATGQRCIDPDVAQSRLMAGSPDLATYLQAGIVAVQSTPLISRTGALVGMISTHWARPYQPSERDLRLFDVLARQAADLIDRTKAEQALRDSEERYRTLFDAMDEGYCVIEVLFDDQRPPEPIDYRFIEVNGCFEQQAGMHDVIGKRMLEFVPAIEPHWLRNYGNVALTGRPIRFSGEYTGLNRFFEVYAFRAEGWPQHHVAVLFQDITARKQAEDVQQMLTSELAHRVKNMLATVQAIATQTLRHSNKPAEFVTSFAGRIQSMSRVHSLLSDGGWQGADLRDLIHDQILLGPVDETRVTAWGPPVRLESQIAPQVAMMLHELGTNSIKYGALSRTDGIVTISWSVKDEMLRLLWAERGGPQVAAPVKRGFGTRLIEQSAKSVGGSAHMSIENDGARWEITVHLPRPTAASSSATSESKPKFIEAMPRREGMTSVDVASPVLAGRRFVVIEDEPLVALELADALRDAGADVVASSSSLREALQVIENQRLDAALLDGNLHGRPVDEIAAALTRCNVPFLFVTGYGRESLPQAFRKAAILSKPFSPQELVEASARLLDQAGDVFYLRKT